MKTSLKCLSVLVLALAVALPAGVLAKDDVSKVIAVRGKALIERDRKEKEAKVNDGVLLADQVSTREASKAKLLFLDDSVLTLGEKSKVSIREYVYSKDARGRSVFNLVDGKMKAVVGRTEFEVHTPTAVAAARGTVIFFETGTKDGKRYTMIQCVEGSLVASSLSPGISGEMTLSAGMSIVVTEGEPLPSPSLTLAGDRDRMQGATDTTGNEITLPDTEQLDLGVAQVAGVGAGGPGGDGFIPQVPPLAQQALSSHSGPTTPVNVNVTFP